MNHLPDSTKITSYNNIFNESLPCTVRIGAIEEWLPNTYHITFKPLSLAFETFYNKAFHIPFNIYFQVLFCVGSKPSDCLSDKMQALTNHVFFFSLSFFLPPRATKSYQNLFYPPRSNSKPTSGLWFTLTRNANSLLWITALHPILPWILATYLRIVSPKCINNHLEALFFLSYSFFISSY